MPLRVVIGVGGGIAAYKAAHLVRYFTEKGHHVNVIPTPSALKFVGAATFEALSGHPVSTDVFDSVDEVQHVRLGQEADLIVIAPATADLMARLAGGRADDLLTSSCLVATCPIVLAPAMHTEMWENPATTANVATLRKRGIVVLEPSHGRLTGKDTGPGRLPEPDHIGTLALAVARCGTSAFDHSLEGRKVVITAGGTVEPLDPVRFLSNASSGRQGFALADVAAQRGAQVTIIQARTEPLPTPSGATIVPAMSALELKAAVDEHAQDADVVIMAAAVADYRPVNAAASKMKKGANDADLSTLELTENPDILAALVKQREAGAIDAETVIVGFAAETGDDKSTPLEHGIRKLAKKGCDLLMCNAVGDGKVFGQEDNAGWLLTAGESADKPVITEVHTGPKLDIAVQMWNAVETLMNER